MGALNHRDRKGAWRPEAALTCFAVLTAAGCMPLPRFERISPRISGIVTKGGVPQPDVPVILDTRCDSQGPDMLCERRSRRTRTDARGRFALRRTSELVFFPSHDDPQFPRPFCWVVCIESAAKRINGSSGMALGLYPQPEALDVSCELDHPGERLGWERGICTSRKASGAP
jgi:hypothetical protein